MTAWSAAPPASILVSTPPSIRPLPTFRSMLKNKPKPSVLDSLVQEYFHLKRVEELLDSIYVEIGPYRDGEVSSETWEKVRKHFKFDDSE